MPSRCIVANCTNTSDNLKGFPFFSFPKDQQLRQQWVEAVNIDETTIKKSTKVCFKHFETTDYHTFATVHKLKKGKVPTLHLSLTAPSEASSVNSPSIADDTEDVSMTGDCVRSASISHQQRGRKRNRRSFINLSYQRQSQFLIENFMTRNAKINYYTGLQSFTILRALFKFVFESEKGPKGAVNQSRKTDKPCTRNYRLTPINELFLTLMKLRRGFDNVVLADMFLISRASVSRIFITWINLLYTKLASLSIWPHKDVLLQNAPTHFLQKYPGVIGSINCVEFNIEKPSSLVRQSHQCYTHHTGTTTLKSLIMVDPNGAIIFVSALFTGSISDKRIMEESGFLSLLRKKVELGKLQHGDIILADKSFKVADVMETIRIQINIPTFRITGLEFAAEDVEYIRTIAHERIHVERAMRRLKAFTILSQRIPVALLGNINQIYTVCALLINFKYPLRK